MPDLARKRRNRGSLIDRYFSKVAASNWSACWNWSASLTPQGYSRGKFDNRTYSGHRVGYELAFGPIPDGLELDHLCRNRACVNPLHLEAVSHRTNLLRADGIPAINHRKTHCPAGHEYNALNTYWWKGRNRRCRICLVAHRAKSRARGLR